MFGSSYNQHSKEKPVRSDTKIKFEFLNKSKRRFQPSDRTDLKLYTVCVRDADISTELVVKAHGRPCAVWSVRIALFIADDTEHDTNHSSLKARLGVEHHLRTFPQGGKEAQINYIRFSAE